MKKKTFFTLFVVICMITLLASCSTSSSTKDNWMEEKVQKTLEENSKKGREISAILFSRTFTPTKIEEIISLYLNKKTNPKNPNPDRE